MFDFESAECIAEVVICILTWLGRSMEGRLDLNRIWSLQGTVDQRKQIAEELPIRAGLTGRPFACPALPRPPATYAAYGWSGSPSLKRAKWCAQPARKRAESGAEEFRDSARRQSHLWRVYFQAHVIEPPLFQHAARCHGHCVVGGDVAGQQFDVAPHAVGAQR